MPKLEALSNVTNRYTQIRIGSLATCLLACKGYRAWRIVFDGRIVLEGGKDCEDESNTCSL